MSLFTLSDDLIWTIKDKVWKLRHKQVIQDFKKEWLNRDPGNLKFLSFRSLHPGRFFLKDNPKDMISFKFPTKYYICGHLIYSDYMFLSYIGYRGDTVSLKRGVLEECIEGGLDISSVDMKDEDAIFEINNLVWGYLMKKEEEQIQQNLKKTLQEDSK
tara:strand:- start:328 stop:801 length:474 start_codon:yes stop_codon:yes gene_type:complete